MLGDQIYFDGATAFWINKTAQIGSNATGGTTSTIVGSVYGMPAAIKTTAGTVSFPIPDSFDLNESSSFSIEVVVTLDESSTFNIFSPYLKLNAGVLEFTNESNTVKYQVEDSEWHHIVAIHDNDFDQLYVNGVLIDEVEVDYDTHTRASAGTLTGGSFQCLALYNLPLEQEAIDDHSEDAFDMTDENYSVYGAEVADFDRKDFEESVVFDDETWEDGDYFDININEDGYLTPGWDSDTSTESNWTGVIPINSVDMVGLEDGTFTNLVENASLQSATGWTAVNCTITSQQNIDDEFEFKIEPDGTSNLSYISPDLTLTPGKYTLAVIMHIEDEHTTTSPAEYARRVVVIADGEYIESEPLNTLEDQIDIEMTFTFEASLDIRIYNGSEITTDLVYLESIMLVEGSEIVDYIDEGMVDVDTSAAGTSLALQPRDVYIEWEGAGAFDVEISQDSTTWTPIEKRTALQQVTGDDYEVRVNFAGGIVDDTSEVRAMRADIGIREDFQLFQVRKTILTGNPFISRVEKSPKQKPQEGLYLTATDYITIEENTENVDETIKMVELWIEDSAVGDILTTTGVTVSNTAGVIGATGATVVAPQSAGTGYTPIIIVFTTAVNAPIVVKNGHISRLVLYTAGSSAAATEVLNSYLEPLKISSGETLTISDLTPTVNDSTWAIKSGG